MKLDVNQFSDDINIINFWFSPESEKFWFKNNADFDEIIKTTFLDYYNQIRHRKIIEYDNYNAESILAEIILLSQIPRYLFRQDKKAFATDIQALKLAKYAIKKKFDQLLTQKQKCFLYMPFMYSEDVKDQRLYIALLQKANDQKNLFFASKYKEIIVRFGRFPHRNKILGRKSTNEEISFLEQININFI